MNALRTALCALRTALRAPRLSVLVPENRPEIIPREDVRVNHPPEQRLVKVAANRVARGLRRDRTLWSKDSVPVLPLHPAR